MNLLNLIFQISSKILDSLFIKEKKPFRQLSSERFFDVKITIYQLLRARG